MDIGGWRSPGLRVAFCRCRRGHPADCAQSRCGELPILSTPARATTSQGKGEQREATLARHPSV
jgi:hypothetical protein